MDKDRFEDVWFARDGTKARTVVMQKVHHEQAEVLYKAGATIYKWYKERRIIRVSPYSWELGYVYPELYSYHVGRCDKRELKRLHKGDVHPRTREAEKRGTVAYCVILEE